MARTRAWWSRGLTTSVPTFNDRWNTLIGSGLDVEGATVQRVIGRLDLTFERGSSNFQPRVEFGVLVAEDPDQDTIWDNQGLDWLHWTTVGTTPNSVTPGGLVRTHWSQRELSFDVAGQRTLGPADTVWLMWSVANADETGPLLAVFGVRTLVLGPDI